MSEAKDLLKHAGTWEGEPIEAEGSTPLQSEVMAKTDLDLAPIARTHANYWKMKFFEMAEEVRKANKGIRRLKKKLSKYEKP